MIKKIISLTLIVMLALGAVAANPKKKATRAKAQTTATTKAKPKKAKAKPAAPNRNEFIVISKKDLNLRVYGKQNGDTVLLAQFPACLSKNKGNKQRKGDMKTPESPAGKPFKITQIQDASTWKHDFKDGRGNILAYGHWFLRLETPGPPLWPSTHSSRLQQFGSDLPEFG